MLTATMCSHALAKVMGGEGGRVAVCPWHVLSSFLSREGKEVPAEGVGFEQEQCVAVCDVGHHC